MFFQVIKQKKGGQATVEYVLLIAMVAGAIMALMSFSGPVNQRLENAKQGMVEKLSGNYKLKREDFFTKKFKPTGELNGEGSVGAGGGGSAGGGGGGGAGAPGVAKTQGAPGEAQGLPKGSGAGEEAQAPTQETQTKVRGGGYENGPDNEDRMRYVDAYDRSNYGYEAGTTGGAGGGGTGSTTELLAEAGKDGGASMGRKRGFYEDEYRKNKALADKEWGIGKFIIIIIVLFFFIFFIMKARQRRD